MLSSLVLTGSLIGLTIAMPMGPIGLMCLRYTLVHGPTYGMISGMGVALADAICGTLAGIGVAAISNFIAANHVWLQLMGSFFLICLGINSIFFKREKNCAQTMRVSHLRIFIMMFFLTLSNPMTIISFTGMYAVMGVSSFDTYIETFFLSLGIFIGSLTWWFILNICSHYFNLKQNFLSQNVINKISGSLIFIFGIFGMIYSIHMLSISQ